MDKQVKRLSTIQLLPGMLVAQDVYSYDNQLVLAKDTVLTDNLITRLDLHGILTIFVKDAPVSEEYFLPPDEGDEGPSYLQRIQNSSVFRKFKADYELNLSTFKDALNTVVERNLQLDVNVLLQNTLDMITDGKGQIGILDMLQNMREYNDSTYTHCLNVGLICNVLATWLKFTPEEISMATACGLFHDVGKLMIPHAIISKPGKLDSQEYALIQKHPIIGYEMLKEQNVDIHIQNAALMHHERQDGSGYPMKLSGEEIESYARLVAIADVYDAMTAARVYRGPLCPFQVIEIFEQECFDKYDVEYLLTFLENVVNTYLRNRCLLSDGREAEIIFINKEKLSRPIVRSGDTYINLAKEPDLTIEKIL